MPKWLEVVLFILLVSAVVLVWDHWRTKGMKAWVAKHNATLHGVVDLARHPELPAAELLNVIEAPGTRRYATAVESQVDGRSAWVLEYEGWPGATKSARWYSLCVIQTRSPMEAQAMLESRRRAAQGRVATSGARFAERRDGVITVGLLDQWF